MPVSLKSLSPVVNALSLAVILAGCATRQAPVVQHLPPVQAPPAYVPPKQVTQAQPKAITRSHWNIAAGGCSEGISLSSGDFSLMISEPKTSTADFSVRLGPKQRWRKPPLRTVRFRFDGSRGSWSTEGQPTRTGAVFGMAADDAFLVKVMALLSGGTAEVLAKNSKLLSVTVPSAGDRGQAWFECMRARIL